MREAEIVDIVPAIIINYNPSATHPGKKSLNSQAVIVLETIQSLTSNKFTIESKPPEAR
jgi:hypothetical protein